MYKSYCWYQLKNRMFLIFQKYWIIENKDKKIRVTYFLPSLPMLIIFLILFVFYLIFIKINPALTHKRFMFFSVLQSIKLFVLFVVTVPSIVPVITGNSGINISTIIVYWDPIPDDREHVKGRVGGYTVRIVSVLFCSVLQ